MRGRSLGGRCAGAVVSTFVLVTVLAPSASAGESALRPASGAEGPSPHHNEKFTYDFDTSTGRGIHRNIPVVLDVPRYRAPPAPTCGT